MKLSKAVLALALCAATAHAKRETYCGVTCDLHIETGEDFEFDLGQLSAAERACMCRRGKTCLNQVAKEERGDKDTIDDLQYNAFESLVEWGDLKQCSADDQDAALNMMREVSGKELHEFNMDFLTGIIAGLHVGVAEVHCKRGERVLKRLVEEAKWRLANGVSLTAEDIRAEETAFNARVAAESEDSLLKRSVVAGDLALCSDKEFEAIIKPYLQAGDRSSVFWDASGSPYPNIAPAMAVNNLLRAQVISDRRSTTPYFRTVAEEYAGVVARVLRAVALTKAAKLRGRDVAKLHAFEE